MRATCKRVTVPPMTCWPFDFLYLYLSTAIFFQSGKGWTTIFRYDIHVKLGSKVYNR